MFQRNRTRTASIISSLALAFPFSISATASQPTPPTFCGPILERSYFLGDWLGARSAFRDQGVTFDISTTQYYQGVSSGGTEQAFEYGGRNDYFVNIDGEKAGLWKGAFITLHGESRYAESINNQTGTLLPANLGLVLPAPNESITALTGIKFMQFLSEEMLVFAGKINTFDDFKQPITGAGLTNGFMHTGLMINPIVIRTIPYSTYGAGFVRLHNLEPVFSLAVFDTNNTPTTTGFDTFFDNGVTIVSNLTLPTCLLGMPGHQGFTGTYSTGTYTNLSPNIYVDPTQGLVVESAPRDGSWSLAYNMDQALYVDPCDPKRRWGVFANLGLADNNPSPIAWFASTGISGASPLYGRTHDTFGAGYFYMGLSNALQDLAPNLLPLTDEHGFEFYYNYAVSPWCHITPDLQVLDPFRERVDSSLVVGMRAKIDF